MNDFGAGVGQYKAAILSRHPDIAWNAYDGAGDIVEYTKGFVEYFDLTMPLELPRADWVISLEVGEHGGSSICSNVFDSSVCSALTFLTLCYTISTCSFSFKQF